MLKANKPKMNVDVSNRFETLEAQQQESLQAQEQITEEVNRFQESFEELFRRVQILENVQKQGRIGDQIEQISSRVETIELE